MSDLPVQTASRRLQPFGIEPEGTEIAIGADPKLGGEWFVPWIDLSFATAWPVKPAVRYPSKVAKEGTGNHGSSNPETRGPSANVYSR